MAILQQTNYKRLNLKAGDRISSYLLGDKNVISIQAQKADKVYL